MAILPVQGKKERNEERKDPPLHRQKHSLDIQVHHLRKRRLRMRLKRLAPRRARIRQQDIDMVRLRADLAHQSLNLRRLGRVRGHRVGLAGLAEAAGERVERVAGFAAGVGFAGGDEDLGASCLEEAGILNFKLSLLNYDDGKLSWSNRE